jgi:hypothetical protein
MSLRALLDSTVSALEIPTVYFDTQVFSWAAKGSISTRDWEEVRRFVRKNAHHCVSLTTLYELLAGVAYGRDESFEHYRDRLRYLDITPQSTYGPLSGEFVRTRIFSLEPRRQDFSPEVLMRCVPIVLRAQARTDLTEGSIVLSPYSPLSWGIDLPKIQGQIRSGKEAYIKRLESLRQSHPGVLSRESWAAGKVIALELDRTLENRQRIEVSLDAVYRHDVSVRQKANNPSYNFTKNASAWLDSQQLHYLADPTYIFITNDGRLKKEAAKSTQSKRIITFQELLGFAECGPTP